MGGDNRSNQSGNAISGWRGRSSCLTENEQVYHASLRALDRGGITEPPYTDFEIALQPAWREKVEVKVPVLVEICPRQSRLLPNFKFEDVQPLLETEKDHFGRDPLLWGSGWHSSGVQVVTPKVGPAETTPANDAEGELEQVSVPNRKGC